MKECLHCEKPLERKRYKPREPNRAGKLESVVLFERRQYCDVNCANLAKRLYQDWELQEELDFLLGTDTPEAIARRLGYADLDGLANRLRQNGQTDLLERLLRLHNEYLEAVR